MTEKQSKRSIVTIVSLFGMIASILGVVTIFFPDALNVSKKRFASFSVQVDSFATLKSLTDFLESQTGNIVDLDVSVCAHRETQCPFIEADGVSLSANFQTDERESCDENESLAGVAIYFDDSSSDKNSWGWEKFEQCKDSDEVGVLSMRGHFLVPNSSGFGQGWSEWLLTPIPAKDIKLKNY